MYCAVPVPRGARVLYVHPLSSCHLIPAGVPIIGNPRIPNRRTVSRRDQTRRPRSNPQRRSATLRKGQHRRELHHAGVRRHGADAQRSDLAVATGIYHADGDRTSLLLFLSLSHIKCSALDRLTKICVYVTIDAPRLRRTHLRHGLHPLCLLQQCNPLGRRARRGQSGPERRMRRRQAVLSPTGAVRGRQPALFDRTVVRSGDW